MFKVNDVVEMIKTDAGLKPMKVGDKFVVTDINNMGVATINDHVTNTTYHLSTDILNTYFVKVLPKVGIDISGVPDTTEIASYINEIDVECLLDGGRIIIDTFFDKCTVVGVQLTNGFVIVESSSCIDPDNYDIDTGIKNCINKIIDKVYELQAFNIQEEVAINKLLNEKEPKIMCEDDGSKTIFSFTEDGWELEVPDAVEFDCEDCSDKNDCPNYDN